MKIKYMVIDVDGVMTDAGIYYDVHGNELKKFSTRDAAGFFALREAGIEVIVLTGRECTATLKRMHDLKVDSVFQGVTNKKEWIVGYAEENNLSLEEIGYIGDDLNDLASMQIAGFAACPADSCKEIIDTADYISAKNGGQGVVRDVAEFLLENSGEWNDIIKRLFGAGV